MHPLSSVHRRGGTIGKPNADPRFTLPLAEQVRAFFREGKIAGVLAIEGALAIESMLEKTWSRLWEKTC
jgi:hypothetical protein